MWHRTIDCLGIPVGVTSKLRALAPALEALLRTYADADAPAALHYELERDAWPQLRRDGSVVTRRTEDDDLVPALELDLYQQVISRSRGLVVHAGAVVGANGAAVVFSGMSGAGKSTLVRGLMSRGFRYLSEECIALRAGRRCAGLARSMHVDDERVAVPPEFSSTPYLLRGRDGLRLFHPPEARVWRGEARTAAVFVIEHADDAGDTLRELSSGELLVALWPMVFRQDADTFGDAAQGLDGVVKYALRTSTPGQALARVLAVAEELGVVA